MPELLITSSIDHIYEGVIYPEQLPLHVTIWQNFMLPDAATEPFIEDIGNEIEGFSPLEIIGSEESRFGINHDVRVRRVIALGIGATVYALHTVLGGIIDRYDGVVRNPEWAYEKYNPHVTFVKGRAIDEEEYRALRTVELVEIHPKLNTKTILKVWDLEEA